MKKLFFNILFFLLSFAIYSQDKDSLPKFDPTRNPFDDLKSAVEVAKESSIRIILDVGGEWCIWFHRM